jgi:hypothetical protein
MYRTVSTTWTRGRKTVRSGDALRVKGLPGQVRFRQHVRLDDGREWLDVVHPQFGFYSVRLGRVGPIPRRSSLRPLARDLAAAS